MHTYVREAKQVSVNYTQKQRSTVFFFDPLLPRFSFPVALAYLFFIIIFLISRLGAKKTVGTTDRVERRQSMLSLPIYIGYGLSYRAITGPNRLLAEMSRYIIL